METGVLVATFLQNSVDNLSNSYLGHLINDAHFEDGGHHMRACKYITSKICQSMEKNLDGIAWAPTTFPIKRSRRFRPGTVALREIRRYQNSSKLLISKYAIRLVIRQILRKNNPGLSIDKTAMKAIQAAAEDHLVKSLATAGKVAHEQKRITILPVDMKVAKYVIDHKIKKRKKAFYKKQVELEEAHKAAVESAPELPTWEWMDWGDSSSEESEECLANIEDKESSSSSDEASLDESLIKVLIASSSENDPSESDASESQEFDAKTFKEEIDELNRNHQPPPNSSSSEESDSSDASSS